ncbi:MAG: hypothetical protein OHK0032_05520 [Thermodesulfovibrionales bacterium]
MKKVPLDSVRSGMRLAKAVLNEAGITLFGEGVAVTEQMIERMRSMNLDSIYIEGVSVPKMPLEDELSMLDARFRGSEEEPHMETLKRLLKEHIRSLYG